MASTYLSRTPSGAGNRTKWTWSAWVKRNSLGGYHYLFNAYTDNSNRTSILTWDGDWFAVDDRSSGTSTNYLLTNRKLRDVNGWYHFVVTVDTSLSTADDRVKIYINGVQETSFLSRTNPPQNHTTHANNNILHVIGKDAGTGYAEVTMSHIHFIDGTAYDASAFGETDATTGEWKIKTSPSVTYGTNGFFILKDGNSVTDQSGNGNNWTVGGGTLTNTEDNPSNVFCTWNALDNANASTMSNGNTKINTVTGNYSPNTSTLRNTLGKWYWEVKLVQDTGSGANEADMVGINNNSVQSATTNPSSIGINYRGNGRVWNYGGTSETPVGNYATFSTGDIIMVAMDLSDATTGKLYFGVNGTWGNSGNPATGANSYDFTKGTEAWGAMVTTYSSGAAGIWEANFGNGYFGTTAVSSAGTNASGNGIFEYDVPTGFTALSTKGLNL